MIKQATFLLTLHLCLVSAAFATEEPKANETTTIKVGEFRSPFADLAATTAKRGVYFFAGLFVVLAALKRWQKRSAPKVADDICISSRKQLSPRSAILILEVRGEQLLLSVSGDDIRFLTKLNSFPAETFEEESEDFNQLPDTAAIREAINS